MDNNDLEQNYEDFISTVSHELRTPLTSIRGFSQTMLASWDKLDDDSKKKFIKIIEEQSNRLIHLVENMLSVTKLRAGNNHFVYKSVEVQTPIEQTISIVKNQYKNHSFEFKCSENIPNVVISVENLGIGIDEKDYSKIFTKFARIDNPLTRKVQGSGLGLYITKNLVEKMGGIISVKSEKMNDNSELSKIRFTVSFPIKSIEEQARIRCNQ